jgi:GINS complex subunit 3
LTFDIDIDTSFRSTSNMSSYYDVDAILTDAQKVPCTFELTVPGLGYLEGNMSGDMKQGSKVELPLWLGEMLALR